MLASNAEGKREPRMRPPMRSSIACTRCRRHKIKCENTNGTSPCDNCVKAASQCVFKIADPVPPKRSEPPVVIKHERDGGSDKKRLKKIDDISGGDNQRATALVEEVLSASFLTEDLWDQVLDLYKIHFAPELSFLHLPTMKEKLGRRSRTTNPDHGLDNDIVLLGVLTLTARFHPDLVRYTAHIYNNSSSGAKTRPVTNQTDPASASEYYAEILAMALGPVRTTMGTASVDRVAALLMLGLYEWSQTEPKVGGMTAWMYVGTAIRMAQFLGLGFEDAKEPGDAKFRAVDLRLKSAGCQSQLALQREIRRRIMFSCFILDRMLACGKYRVTIIRGEDLDIQLPCPEDKFDLAMEVQTGRLSQLDCAESEDSVLSRFIQLVNLWGEISKYSSRGGRVEDKHPPWYPASDFYKLNKAMENFDLSLPNAFAFSRSNYFKHENHQASSVFVLLHMLRFVSLIMLHREYVPFVPVRCREPEGPLDRPTFTKEETPAGFWRTSAEQLFKAAKGIVDLIEICQRKDKLPQSTIVVFAIWTAAFVGLYGAHFPQMDTEGYMLQTDPEGAQNGGDIKHVFERGPTAIPFRTLIKMSTWQKMASTYVNLLQDMNDYFDAIKQDYYKYSDKNGRPNQGTPRVREGGTGGGLEEYQFLPLGSKLKGFSNIWPDEHDVRCISERFRRRNSRADHSEVRNNINDTLSSTSHQSGPPSLQFTAASQAPTASISTMTESNTLFPQIGMSVGRPQTPVNNNPYATGPWPYHDNTPQQQQQPSYAHTHTHLPLNAQQSCPAPGQTAHWPGGHNEPEDMIADDGEHFWDKLQRDEQRRFDFTGDLSLFSTGQSEISVADMPFGGSSYIPIMSESSYQLLDQSGYFQQL